MFTPIATFSGFTVNDMDAAKDFYTSKLGLQLIDDFGGSQLVLPEDKRLWMYQKADHQPATYTALNFIVPNIEEAVDALVQKGISFEKYDGMPQDDKGIMRGKEHNMGPNIAWFKDPAGNILSVVEV